MKYFGTLKIHIISLCALIRLYTLKKIKIKQILVQILLFQFLLLTSVNADNFAYIIEGNVDFGKNEEIYRDLIACTFPVSGNSELLKILNPEFEKSNYSGDTYLHEKYKKTNYHIIRLPRSIYEYMFLVYCKTQNPSIPITNKFEIDENMISNGNDNIKLNAYYESIIDNLKDIHNEFNKWAVKFLESAPISLQSQNVAAGVLPLNDKKITIIINELYKKIPLSKGEILGILKSPGKDEVIINNLNFIANLENDNHGYIFIYRGVKDGINGYNTMRLKNNNNDFQAFSTSFSPSLFGGILNDTYSSPFGNTSDDKEIRFISNEFYILSIEIKTVKLGGPSSYVFIPSFPIIYQIIVNLNEFWHPRTKIIVLKEDISKQRVYGGIFDFTEKQLLSDPNGKDNTSILKIEKLKFLYYNNGCQYENDKSINISDDFEKYVKNNARMLPNK